jgi:hypothetical protein
MDSPPPDSTVAAGTGRPRKLCSYTEFVNVHTRESLALSATTAGTRVLQQPSGDTLWTVP